MVPVKEEERRISPAVVIVPLSIGLGAVALVGIMAMAGAAAPPPPAPGRGTLHGKVTDSESGSALVDALLTLNGLQTYTDTAGNYTFSDVEPGAYTLNVKKTGWISISEAITLPEGLYQIDVVMTPISGVILEFPSIDILSINNIPFSETGHGAITYPCTSCDGTGKVTVTIPYYGTYVTDCGACGGTGQLSVTGHWARLREPIVADTLRGAITVKMYNKTIRLSDALYRDLGLHVFYQISGGPSFSSRAGITLYKDEQGYPYRNPPFEFAVTPMNVIGAGSWVPKLYSAQFRVFAQYWETEAGSATIQSFYVLDFLKCTGSGSVSVY